MHEVPLHFAAGDFIRLEAAELHGDVFLEIQGPGIDDFAPIDSSQEDTRVEPLLLVTEASGSFLLRVQAFVAGVYELRLHPPRPATAQDRLRATTNRAFYEARDQRKTDPTAAAALYRQAIRGWQQLGEPAKEARGHYELAELLPSREEFAAERIAAYEQAVKLYEGLGNLLQAARCRHVLGGIFSRRGDSSSARAQYRAALELWRQLRQPHAIAIVAHDLAQIEWRVGRPDATRRLLQEALELARQQKDVVLEARIRTVQAAFFHYHGQTARAVQEGGTALAALEAAESMQERRVRAQWAVSATQLAMHLAYAVGSEPADTARALRLLAQARILRLRLFDRPGLAMTTNSLGLVYEALGREHQARAAFEQALELYRQLGQAGDAAVVLSNVCRIVSRLGDLEAARTCSLEALEAARATNYHNTQAQVLHQLAVLDRRRGRLREAAAWIASAIEILEFIRKETESDDLERSLAARKQDFYLLAVDLTLELDEREPGKGHAEAAFETMERGRSRSLLEGLAERLPEREGQRPLRELRERIHRLGVDRLLAAEQAGAPPLAPSDVARLERLEEELAMLLDRFYGASPRQAFLEPPIISAAEAQKLLDPETLLLEYHLGPERSVVWAITDEGLSWRPLAARQEIEAVARQLQEALRSGPHQIQAWSVDRLSRELSRLVLEPVADLLERPRLAIVPAGTLNYVPFAVLPHPSQLEADSPEPLLGSHQITSLPSVSVLAALRRRQVRQASPPGLLALLAAPVLRADDPRLRKIQHGDRRRLPERDLPIRLTVPVPHLEREAQAILRLVADGETLNAQGFDASRELVLSGLLADYQIVHFATHGHLDDDHGELSGLVLSQFDHEGRTVDGFLWAFELLDLELRAELVVLSACETALGEEVEGEGLVGLTRGFFYAGAQRLLVSLWSVDDEATAHLMASFYQGLLGRHLAPAEALRQAQNELRRQGWREPFYWAPFILQGDWTK